MANYRLYPKAEADLEDIWRYSDENWGDKQADKYVDELEEVFYLLAENPLLCRERTELDQPVYIHNHAHHLIVYVITESGIDIVRLLHSSLDIPAHIAEEP